MLTTVTLLTLMAAGDALPACPVVIRPPAPPPPVVVVVRPGRWAQPPPPPPPVPTVPPVIIRCPGPRQVLYLGRPPQRRFRRVYLEPWPYHRKSTPYVGVETGYLALFAPQGSPFRRLQPTAWVAGYFGWNFNPFFGLELGLGGSPMKERHGGLGGMESVGLAALTLDAKIRLVQPAPDNPIVPFLQAGLGGYWLGGTRAEPSGCGDQGCMLAQGVGAHVGGGLDFYLFRGALLGVRVLYRHLFLHAKNEKTPLPSLSATVHFTIFWSHR